MSITALQKFLLCHRVEKGAEFTHTGLARPAGAFYIGGDDEEEFLSLYAAELAQGEKVYLTERHRDVSPLIVDLDIKFALPAPGTAPQRTYTLDHMAAFVKAYVTGLAAFLVLPAEFDVHMMEKPGPVAKAAFVKDGVHFMVPGVVASLAVQRLLREAVLPAAAAVFAAMHAVNAVDDIYDRAVLGSANWMMYGSRKPDCETYQLTRTFRVTAVDGGAPLVTDAGTGASALPLDELVAMLSVRNKYGACRVQDAMARRVEEYTAKEYGARRTSSANLVGEGGAVDSQPVSTTNTCDNLEHVRQLVGLLSPTRAEGYEAWMRVGWCLRNIDHRLLEDWVKFSRGSPKYVAGECEDKWLRMIPTRQGLGMGSLLMWCRSDNPTRFREVARDDLRRLVTKARSGNHHDVARVVKQMYGHRFVCASLRNRVWYEFRNHRWHVCDSGFALRKFVSTDVWNEFKTTAAEYNTRARAAADDDEQLRYSEAEKKLSAVAEKLKIAGYKDNLLKECMELFYEDKFEERLDGDRDLLAFENGVYDLAKHEFRDGRPEDYITFTTGIDYEPYDAADPAMAEIDLFMSQVQPVDCIRKYVLICLASFLSGRIQEERFLVWTGSGGNGKSRLVELFEEALGDYCCKFPVTMLTQKRAASGAANSELARAKGKRMACLQEPAEDEKLNVGLMKELSGGDKIIARNLYSAPIEFLPQFHLLLMCNQLPTCPSDDNGTWRRVRVVEFSSKFVESPNPHDPTEFPIDLELKKKFLRWKQPFVAMLLEYFRMYQVEGLLEPAEVMQTTLEYQRSNDFIADFIVDSVDTVIGSGGVCMNDLYEAFREWSKGENLAKLPRRRDLQLQLQKKFGRPHGRGSDVVFKDIALRQPGQQLLIEDDDEASLQC